jgi:cysteine desulfurase/selenocysteine lyase
MSKTNNMLDTDAIRRDFPILSRKVGDKPLIYLDNAATSQKPQSVIDAIVDYYQNHNANVHRGIHTLGDEATQMYAAARLRIARFLGTQNSDEVVFTKNTTEGINLLAQGWAQKFLTKGDEILVTDLEHHSDLLPWQRVCRTTGASLVHLPISANGDLALVLLPSLVGPRTKLVALTHISNVLGTVNDIQHVAKDIKKAGSKALILVDCAQSVPHLPVNVEHLGADAVVFSGHKMLGPMGIGVLWAKRSILHDTDPLLLGGGMIDQVRENSATWADLPDKFDAGTPNVSGAVGLAAACDYLANIGLENIHLHEQALTRYALEKLQPLEEQGMVTLYGPRDPQKRADIITFNVTGAHAHDVAQVLDRQFGIAARSGHHCNQPLMEKLGVPATVRASFYLYNTIAEIDTLIEGITHIYQMFKH